ncbi:hypothetical protein HPB48_010635 [Haemaphysalis longicornis]|uniref:Uncharacterized protein n=1 Tax=Haemaphysalis longicornis TaxID=44386 RepID=A0A9J6G0M7_HAELO|nr:hypothetical protein HPB48_010635 [Haemaphysalis longicornis]
MSTDVLLNAARNGAGDVELEGVVEDRRDWRPEVRRSVSAPDDPASNTTDVTAGGNNYPEAPPVGGMRPNEVIVLSLWPRRQSSAGSSDTISVPLCSHTAAPELPRTLWEPDGTCAPRAGRRTPCAAPPGRCGTGSSRRGPARRHCCSQLTSCSVLLTFSSWSCRSYTLLEDRPNPWFSTPVVASLRIPVILFWEVFSFFFFFFRVLYEPLARWKHANKTFIVLLGDEVRQA